MNNFAKEEKKSNIFAELKRFMPNIANEINAKDDKGNTPLLRLLGDEYGENTVEMIQVLLDLGADINVKNNMGYTPLLMACGARNYNYENKNFYANDNNVFELDVIEKLLNSGADITCKDIRNNDALIMSICGWNCNVGKKIGMLVDAGVDINNKNCTGKNSIIVLCETIGKYFAKYPNDAGKFPDLFIEVLEILIEIGTDVNICVNKKRNAISYLFQYSGDWVISAIKMILENGFDIKNIIGCDCDSILHDAWNKKTLCCEKIKLLADYKCDLNMISKHKIPFIATILNYLDCGMKNCPYNGECKFINGRVYCKERYDAINLLIGYGVNISDVLKNQHKFHFKMIETANSEFDDKCKQKYYNAIQKMFEYEKELAELKEMMAK